MTRTGPAPASGSAQCLYRKYRPSCLPTLVPTLRTYPPYLPSVPTLRTYPRTYLPEFQTTPNLAPNCQPKNGVAALGPKRIPQISQVSPSGPLRQSRRASASTGPEWPLRGYNAASFPIPSCFPALPVSRSLSEPVGACIALAHPGASSSGSSSRHHTHLLACPICPLPVARCPPTPSQTPF
jgi:hypothetical protein